jgi:hypothetical protein
MQFHDAVPRQFRGWLQMRRQAEGLTRLTGTG